ncbi:MAG: hypothetical protein ABSD89_05190 [Halobacteriota archaeon]
MVTKKLGCYYGVHFGCLNAACDPNCDMCAERLTNAVNYVLHQGVSSTDAPRTCTWPGTGVAAEAREKKVANILRGEHNVWRDSELPPE